MERGMKTKYGGKTFTLFVIFISLLSLFIIINYLKISKQNSNCLSVNEELSENAKNLNLKINALQQEMDYAKDSAKIIEKDLSQCSETSKNLREQLDRTKSENEDKTSNILRLNNEIQKTKEELAKIKSDYEALLESNNIVKGEKLHIQGEYDKIFKEYQSLKEKEKMVSQSQPTPKAEQMVNKVNEPVGVQPPVQEALAPAEPNNKNVLPNQFEPEDSDDAVLQQGHDENIPPPQNQQDAPV